MTSDPWDNMDARLRAAIGSVAGELAESGASQWQGRMLGNYRIEERVAVGGMGVVFRASRSDEQFERQVAIKLLNSPLASDDARRRFRAERQILANLAHPNIAQLLDGGTTEEGVPYLVMEYIEGLPIDRYCQEKKLSTEARLRRFVQVCAAVQYAHQHLIVHRDIKASNILVAADGTPKLLDFGIAKLLDPGDGQAALTMADARLLTPRNASPEQVRGAPITTASDIYSLGVLLYELLTGQQPYRLSSITPLELERAICQRDPEPPSRINQQLAGELDHIVMAAMRKEPERRYPTARQLADDIERHLDKRPITARPDTWRYRTRKFLQRHTLATAAATAVALTIAGLVTFYTLQLSRERDQLARERATAEEVSDFLVGLFEVADPSLTRPDVTARDVLQDGAARIAQLRTDQPLVAARLMISMARAHSGLGMYERSQELISEALDVRRGLLPAGDPRIGEALHYLGVTQLELRKHDEALETLREALRLRESALGTHALPVGETLFRMSTVQHRRGDYPAMGAALERALPIHERALGADNPATAEVLRNLGIYYYLISEHDKAREALQRALTITERAYGSDSIRTVGTLQALGRLEWQLGTFDEAIRLYTRTLAIKETHLGHEHPDLGVTLYGLAVSSKDLGAFSESRAWYDRVIALQEKVLGPDDFFLALSLSGDGFLKLELGELKAAETSFRRSLAIAERKWGPVHPDLRAPLAGLAKTLIEQEQFAEAQMLLDRALQIVEAKFPPEHVDVTRTISTIATMNRKRGRHELARKQFEDVMARFERSVGLQHPFATETLLGMGETLKAAGELERAETFYLAALENHAGPYSEKRVATAECLEGYADLLRRRGKMDEADAVAKRAAAIRAYLSTERAKSAVPGRGIGVITTATATVPGRGIGVIAPAPANATAGGRPARSKAATTRP